MSFCTVCCGEEEQEELMFLVVYDECGEVKHGDDCFVVSREVW